MADSERTPQKLEESFGVVVFRGDKKEEVLLVKTDHWGFPKGHAEGVEDHLSAAVREVREETGIAPMIDDAGKMMTEEYEIRRGGFVRKKTVTYFIGKGEGEPFPREGETHEARWVESGEALRLLSYDSSRAILESLL